MLKLKCKCAKNRAQSPCKQLWVRLKSLRIYATRPIADMFNTQRVYLQTILIKMLRMKRIVLSALVVIGLTGTSTAQSLLIENYDQNVELNSRIIDDHYGHITVKNTSGAAVNVWVKRKIFGTSASWCAFDSAYFCWDLCYGNATNNSVGGLSVGAGQSNSAFSGHVYSTGNNSNCADSIRYTFYNQANPNDSASVVVKYMATSAFSVAEDKLAISKMYPNPAANFVVIELGERAQAGMAVDLYNLLGAKVRSLKVSGNRIEIPVADLHNGIYLCTLTKNGKTVETRKITVRH
jgi:hypothetical protein